MRLPPTYPCPWQAGAAERAGARPRGGARSAPRRTPAHCGRTNRRAGGPRRTPVPICRRCCRPSACCNPPCLPGKGAPRAASTAIPRAKMLARPGYRFLLSLFGFADLLGRRSLAGKLWGRSSPKKRFRTGAFAAHGTGLGPTSRCFSHRTRLPKRQTRAMATRARGARWFVGRASAAGAEFNRPPPIGFFVPGAFT